MNIRIGRFTSFRRAAAMVLAFSLCAAAHAEDVFEPTDIQGLMVAIASAHDGDTIILPDGTNSFADVTQDEMTNELAITKAVLVTSRSGDPKDVMIDLGGTGWGFTLNAAGARLRGITFTSSVAVRENSGTHDLPRFVNVVAGTVDACVFRDVKITGNKYGGFAPVRLYVDGVIDNCLFTNISSSVEYPHAPHGTVYATGGVISNSQFVACNTYQAPLVMAGGVTTVYVEDCLFRNTVTPGGAAGVYCGAIYATGGSTTFPRAFIRRTAVANCKADSAGAVYNGGGNGFKPMIFEDCVFTNNTSGVGVVAGGERANITFDRCLIADNVGSSHGVTAGSNKGEFIFRNCLIRGNCGKSTAGVVSKSDVYCGVQFENCTVTGNKSESGSVGGISIPGCGNASYKTWVKNCIVWGNTAAGTAVQLNADAAKVFSSCYPEADPENTNGNISNDPRLAADGKLQYTSPCLDVALDLTTTAGTNDLVGTVRPQDATGKGEIWDMGCFEMPPNTEPLVVSVSIDQTVGASPATVTATATVAGAKTSGLTYDWMIVCTAPNVSTNVEKGCTDASHAFSNLAPGAYEISVTVRNDSGDFKSVTCEQGFSAKPAVCYISKTGSATWPYDAPERATSSFADAIANAAERVAVLADEYDLSGWTELLEISAAVEVVSASGNAADVVLDLGGTGCGFTLNNAGAKIGNVTFVSSATMGDSTDLTLPRFVNVIAGTVEGCVFRDVTLGGTNNKGSYPVKLLSSGTIAGCVFSNFVNNVSSPKQGGVIFSQGGLVSNCNFIACNAYQAPIVVSGGYSLYVEDSLFTGVDSTGTTAGALYGIGGNTTNPRAVFRRTTVANNRAASAGVAYYSSGDSSNKPMTFEDCVFANNTATSGIGVFDCSTGKAPVNCTRCLIADNVGASQGVICASIYVTHIFRNCLICGNTGKSTAGVVSGSGASNYFKFESCTVTGNRTETGTVGGINIAGCGTTANTWVKNCVVWGNEGPEGAVQLNADAAKVSYSCYPEADPTNANGNTPDDPKLRTVKRYRGYPSPAGSCYEAGNATGWTVDDVDLSGAPRLRDGKIDIGCYQAVPLPGLLLMLK